MEKIELSGGDSGKKIVSQNTVKTWTSLNKKLTGSDVAGAEEKLCHSMSSMYMFL
jgi:hypothetical protein